MQRMLTQVNSFIKHLFVNIVTPHFNSINKYNIHSFVMDKLNFTPIRFLIRLCDPLLRIGMVTGLG